ncbi:MAG: PQQ-binding-like beta-propeller repeat protein [Phycisphaerae bacterium]|nr:PQQ-binding-like beta-propeller repeat protein [Phycisphaerae bacterium]NIP50773.1 PQQ-binding-like beta-propeller repeat protein [Phycisphaerae bacterium]NIS49937.1 PQQ-binding-like beta-propeller repeat protein [Phycisphaerae bacterium]NIU07641.1 PQQ-binding-like beta-propeller repeat protein [Phycisphaerae bacterium]NIU57423.1 PQQ-binding-like beta-propeller repeat protein [Phycisphaerae bacterium]
MKESIIARLIPVALVIVGVVSLYLWLKRDAAAEFTTRLPIPDNILQASSDEDAKGPISGELVRFDGVPADLPGAWPRFRGANFDAISTEQVDLAETWGPDGPAVLWSIDVGEGYAGAAILAGRVYLMDYDRPKEEDVIRCLSLEDGKDIWRYSYPIKVKRWHGMSRTIPAVTEKYVVALGPKCHLTCLDSDTGQFRWMLNLVSDFNCTVPDWYAGQCPLIDDGKAIIAVGGDALMMAIDCETGEIVWKSPNPKKWVMTHSSVIPAEFKGTRMYVYCGSGGVAGISAEDGSILWEINDWKIRIANVPSPVVVGDGLIFLSGGYEAGSMMLQLTGENGTISAQPTFRLKPEVFGSEQQTPIFYDGHIYGIRPDKLLTCLNLDGQVVWTSPATHRFGPRGLGPYMIADDKIFIMDDEGLLTMAKAQSTGYEQLAEAKILEGPESWGPMAIASGKLILRDMNRMICLDVTGQ